MLNNRLSLTLLGLVGLVGALAAQAPAARTPAMTEEPVGSGPLDRLAFRQIGPAAPSGRIDDFAVLESDPSTFYVAAATGGIHKTTNGGITFTPVFDHESTSSVGDIAIAPTDANLIWAGTGENNNRQSSSWGDGIFKSTDGGRSWKNMGLRTSRHIARVVVDPVDFNVVHVAALGDLWATGGERGVYKTSDGGQTWKRTLHVDDDTGATELVMDPLNNKVLYAATYQRRRTPWGMNGGGTGSGIWKSMDAGETWTKIETGIPAGPKGRIGMDIYRANPNVLYARVEHETESGLYRTDDAGATWRKMSDVNPRPMYFSQVRIDPRTDSRIYVLGVQLHVSDDAGKTFRSDGAGRIHVDFHAMWIDPANPQHIILGGDGGVSMSRDRAQTWQYFPNLVLAQAYHVAYDMRTPFYRVCAGLQDNNTWCGPSAVRTNSGIGNDEWYVVNGGDGFQPLMDPTDPNVIYAESQGGRMNRIDGTTNERTAVRPEPLEAKEGEPSEYRYNWDTAMQLSPHDPSTIYIGAQMLMKSSDRGRSYAPISGDLSTNTNRETLSIMGTTDKDITVAKNDGISTWGTIVTLEESARRAGVIWTGTDDGVVSITRDAGKTWNNLTAKFAGVPKWTYVSDVVPSQHADGTAYIAFDGHRGGDYGTYVFSTTDFGASTRSIAGNLPKGEVVRTILEDPNNADLLYLGSETGLWVSHNRGGQWTKVKANLPTTPIYEMKIHPRENDLILATHARGIWILDDAGIIQQWAKAESAGTFAFDPEPAVAFNQANDKMRGFEGDMQFLGLNPAPGATLAYRLAGDAKQVSWLIRDGNTQVRELSGDEMKDRNTAGLHIVKWDLRVQPLRPLPPPPGGPAATGGGGGGGFGGGGNNGPFVLPGNYRATLRVDGKDVQTVNVTVKGDPEIRITDADRKTWFDSAKGLHDLQAEANGAAEVVQNASAQLRLLEQQTRTATVPAPAKKSLDDLSAELRRLRTRLGLGNGPGGGGGFGGGAENVRGRIGQLKNAIMGSTSVPTTTQLAMIREVRAALPKVVEDAKAAGSRMPGLVRDLIAAGVIFTPVK